MPVLDGFGVLREIGAQGMPAVIFVTAYNEFAVRAFDAHALDYLVKPLEVTRFADAVQRVRTRLRASNVIQRYHKLAALLSEYEKDRARQRIIVPRTSVDLVIDSEEIDWIEADDYYAAVHVRDKRHLIRESLGSLEERLDKTRFV